MVVGERRDSPFDTTVVHCFPSIDASTLKPRGVVWMGGGAPCRPRPIGGDLNWISVIVVADGNSTWYHMPAFCVTPVVHPSKFKAPPGEAVLPFLVSAVLLAVSFHLS